MPVARTDWSSRRRVQICCGEFGDGAPDLGGRWQRWASSISGRRSGSSLLDEIHTWRRWEDEAHRDPYDSYAEITKALTMRRQSRFMKFHMSNPLSRNCILVWVTCFFRQFGKSVVRADYLTLRRGFIMNHNLTSRYDFHSYMIRSMEEEFQMIVGVSAPLWGFVIAFMLFNINGSNLYSWIAVIPIVLVLLVGAKLQYVIATLALESAGISEFFPGAKLKPRDGLFWFRRPEFLLSLIHFILFQNSFELASFFWVWWQFGYDSCFIRNHFLVYVRLILGFAGQFLCSYSRLPLYALVTQMGSNYKAALIPRSGRRCTDGVRKQGGGGGIGILIWTTLQPCAQRPALCARLKKVTKSYLMVMITLETHMYLRSCSLLLLLHPPYLSTIGHWVITRIRTAPAPRQRRSSTRFQFPPPLLRIGEAGSRDRYLCQFRCL